MAPLRQATYQRPTPAGREFRRHGGWWEAKLGWDGLSIREAQPTRLLLVSGRCAAPCPTIPSPNPLPPTPRAPFARGREYLTVVKALATAGRVVYSGGGDGPTPVDDPPMGVLRHVLHLGATCSGCLLFFECGCCLPGLRERTSEPPLGVALASVGRCVPSDGLLGWVGCLRSS